MLSTKARTTVISLIAALGFTAATMVPAVSQAQEKAGGQTEKKGCSYKTPVGTELKYNDGDKIKVKIDNLPTQTYECQNGTWVWVAAMVSGGPTFVVPSIQATPSLSLAR